MNEKYGEAWSIADHDPPAFNYTTSYSIATWTSLHALNEKLDNKVGLEWFRSNIIIATDSDEPFQEDQWTGRIKIGDKAIIKFAKPCNR